MGRLLNELIAESIMAEAANPANPANLEGRVPRVSQELQGARTSEMRAHILALCADEYLPRRLVNALPDIEVAACIEYGDAEVRTYLHAPERGRVVDAGQVPPEYTATVHCARCGPVLLWPSCPQVVKACPWCFRRQGGKPIRRPMVRCGDCQQYRPHRITADGTCTAGHPTTWPTRPHRCTGWTPAGRTPQEAQR